MPGSTSRPGISVIICAYADERRQQLAAAVASAREQSAPALEIIVVIDHNRALLARASRELPDARVVPNDGVRGLSGARNTGVSIARGEVVAFLDDDATAAPDWLEWLSRPYSDPRVLGVGGAIEPQWADGRPAGFPAEFQWVVGCSYVGMPERRSVVRNVIGANMSLRRELFGLAGGFRSEVGRLGRLPLGCEETELCIRARQRQPDGLFLYEPRARVLHHVPRSRTTWRYFASRCVAEGLSKAQVAAWTGSADALASERVYVRRTLPAGVRRGLAAARRGDLAGLARAGRIVAGLALTTLGYVTGSVRFATAAARARHVDASHS
jgi:GT2 family glycosyltransferase